MHRILAISAIFLFAVGPVQAETQTPDLMMLSSVSATRVEAGHVELHVTYEGGACEEMTDPVVTPGYGETNAVTLQTVSTAEVCTKQIVTVEFTGLIPVEPIATTLAVTVLDTSGQPMAHGSATIE